ncbi:MAG: PadR family transcriptional regulator, partial [Acidimicrobiia bacterium]|nr:PadR family transcriptional regulator [Acidimicrobiia bacterium]
MRLNRLSLLDQIVLALVAESPRHGFDVAENLATDEALSLAVTVRRPLVYRALDDLAAAGLITVARREPGSRG